MAMRVPVSTKHSNMRGGGPSIPQETNKTGVNNTYSAHYHPNNNLQAYINIS
jgi:hypothetical protein